MKKLADVSTSNKYIFTYKEDAEKTLRQAKEIASIYGYITLGDICDFIGAESVYTDNLVGWSLVAIEKAKIYEDYWYYVLYFPERDWSREPEQTNEKAIDTNGEPEPINITISSNEWDTRRNDIEQVFNELFRNSDKIKDRPVFITIM